MKYCPVIFEIVDDKLKEFYVGNYLLLVYDKKGDKIF
jgi:hypothetical protein